MVQAGIVFEQHRGTAKAPLGTTYRPRKPERSLLYQTTLDHLNTMLAEARDRTTYGFGYPRHVERAFRSYLTCGLPQRGFARLRCKACGFEHLLAFSCKSRICPSCHARRMHDTALHVVENILPDVGHRQWVLTVPYDIRPLLLRDPKLFAQVSRIFVRALFSYQRRLAAQEGCTETYPAALAFPQLFGGALNPHPHLHVLAPDGVHVGAGPERPLDFLELGPPSHADVERLLKKVAGKVTACVTSYLEEHGCDTDATDSSQDDDDQLRAQVMGNPPSLYGAPDLPQPPPSGSATPYLSARQDGFSLHAGTSVRVGDKEGLLRLVRYCARQAFSQKQLSELEDGRLCYALKRPFGPHRQRALVITPTELLHRLAQLVPKPYFNLTRYYGAYAPNARRRAEICPLTAPRKRYPRRCENNAMQDPKDPALWSAPHVTEPDTGRPARIPWAELLRRTHHDDILRCPKCLEVAMSVIAVITDCAVLKKILTHLNIPTTLPSLAPARYPDTQLDFDWDARTQDDTEWAERHSTPARHIEARAPS